MKCEICNRKLTTEDLILEFEQCKHCRASIALATFEEDEQEEDYYDGDGGYTPVVEGLVEPLPTLDEIERQDMFSLEDEEWM